MKKNIAVEPSKSELIYPVQIHCFKYEYNGKKEYYVYAVGIGTPVYMGTTERKSSPVYAVGICTLLITEYEYWRTNYMYICFRL